MSDDSIESVDHELESFARQLSAQLAERAFFQIENSSNQHQAPEDQTLKENIEQNILKNVEESSTRIDDENAFKDEIEKTVQENLEKHSTETITKTLEDSILENIEQNSSENVDGSCAKNGPCPEKCALFTADENIFRSTAHMRRKCGDENNPLSCCVTGFLDSSKSSDSSSATSDMVVGKFVTGSGRFVCKGPDAARGHKKEEAKMGGAVARGFGDAIFFSDDILGMEPATLGKKFKIINPEKTRHRLIDLQYRSKQPYIPIRLAAESLLDRNLENDLMTRPPAPPRLVFHRDSYNPKLYASRYPHENCDQARHVIIERLRAHNMAAPHIGRVLTDLNVPPDEFYPPKITFEGPLLFVNHQKSNANLRVHCFSENHAWRKNSVTSFPQLNRGEPVGFPSLGTAVHYDASAENYQNLFKESNTGGGTFRPPQRWKIPLGVTGPFFPLEMFDNEMFEVRTPAEWLRLGVKNSVQYPVPAKAFLRHFQRDDEASKTTSSSTINKSIPTTESKMAASWEDVGVRSYDPQDQVYIVSPVHKPDLRYRLPRIYICFCAEIATNFAQRVVDAIRRRREQETQLQYNLLVASLPLKLESFPRLEAVRMDRIIESIKRGKLGSVSLEKEEALKEEIERLHAQFSMKHFHHYTRKEGRTGLYHSSMPELLNEYHAKMPHETEYLKKTSRGTVLTGGRRQDFDNRVKKLKTKFLFVQRPIIEAMGIVIENCAKFDDESFFVFDMPPLTLKEFADAQALQLEGIMRMIRGKWLDNITGGLIEHFGQAGTWYDIHVKRWDVYKISKLSVFIDLVKFNMESCIRNLLTRSIVQLSEFIARRTRSKDIIQNKSLESPLRNLLGRKASKTSKAMFENYSKNSWSSGVIETNRSDAETFPIFLVTLSMCPHKGPCFTTPLHQFETILEEVFKKPIAECHKIPQPEPRILTKFKYPKETYIGSLGFLDRDATGPLEKMKTAIRTAVEPLRDFATEFEQYFETYTLDVEEFIKDFESKNHPATVVKKEIESRLEYLEKLESDIPEQVIMGPFYVDVTDLKYQLVGISQDVCDRLCESFEDRLSEVMREAMVPYAAWYAPLVETHQAVEKYMEMVDRLDELPSLVQEQDKNVRRMQQDYEILDHFNYLMKEESYKIKYEALTWPYKIKVKLGVFVEKVEEELEKFRRNQIKDEMSLQEKLSAMFGLLTNLVETQDIEKIHEFSNDFRRAWKQLVELDTYAEVLNMRQDLLKLPVTPFDQTKELMAEFAPYKDFWTTASEFYKMLQQWTERPLTQLHLSTIQRSFKSFERVINYCEKHFKTRAEMLENVQSVKREMDKFRDSDLPILDILMNPCMTEETWVEFGKAISYENFVKTEKMSLNKFLKIPNVTEHLDLLKALNEEVNRECVREDEDEGSLKGSIEERIKEQNVESESFKSLKDMIEHKIYKAIEDQEINEVDSNSDVGDWESKISNSENFDNVENGENV